MRKILKGIQIGFDLILIFSAFCVAYFFRVGFIFSTDFPFDQFLPVALVASVLTLFFAFLIKTYQPDQKILSWHHFLRTGFSAILQTALFAIIYYFFYQEPYSRLILVLVAIFSLTLVYIGHLGFDKFIRFLYSKGKGGCVRTLLIGTNREAQKLIKFLKTSQSRHYVVSILDGYGSSLEEIEGVPVKGKLNKLESVVTEDKIEQIIQVDNLEQVMNIMLFAEKNKLTYILVPSVLGEYHKNIQSAALEEDYPVLKVQ